MCQKRKDDVNKNKCLKNRNFFGASISKLENNVKSCAFREIWKYDYIDGNPHTEQAWQKQKIKTIGSFYNFDTKTANLSNIFDFENDKVKPVVSCK